MPPAPEWIADQERRFAYVVAENRRAQGWLDDDT